VTGLPPPPPPSSPAARRVMQGNRGRDTRPELALRRELHRRGLRYRVHAPPVPGLRFRADIVFKSARVACEVRGCLWHRCPDCDIGIPRTNTSYWRAKLERNVTRDERNAVALAAAGWTLVVVWEHEKPAAAADRVSAALAARRAGIPAAANGR
jgi:DNA mismatch endonuclease (patch repair protein)